MVICRRRVYHRGIRVRKRRAWQAFLSLTYDFRSFGIEPAVPHVLYLGRSLTLAEILGS